MVDLRRVASRFRRVVVVVASSRRVVALPGAVLGAEAGVGAR